MSTRQASGEQCEQDIRDHSLRTSLSSDTTGMPTWEEAEAYYDREIESAAQYQSLKRLERVHGREFHQWIEEGVPTAAMGDRQNITAYRYWKGTPVPWDIAQRNRDSLWRSTDEVLKKRRRGPAGRTRVPEEVRDVISSPGQSLDSSIQETVEERMGDSLGDVRIHTGPKAAEAAEAINARAFTVGNHIAFNHGEYDPESAEGQHVLAHELAHVRQQTGGAVSMLPQRELALEIDPDPELEREAEETAERVMKGGELGIQRLANTEVYVQRLPEDQVFDALGMFREENESGDVGEFQQLQNTNRISHLREVISDLQDRNRMEDAQSRLEDRKQDAEVNAQLAGVGTHDDVDDDEVIENIDESRTKEQIANRPDKLDTAQENVEQKIQELTDGIEDKLAQVGLTEEQRDKLDNFETGAFLGELAWTTVKGVLSLVPGLGPVIAAYEVGETVLREFWEQTDGSWSERISQFERSIVGDDTGEGQSQRDDLT